MYDQVISDSRPIRSAAMAQNKDKAMQFASRDLKPEMLRARQALETLADEVHTTVDQQSEELAARTSRTILITWIVIALGLAAYFAIALSIVQVEVVKVVMSFRGRILDVAEGRLDQPMTNLDRPNEIGEMSRALQTLQLVSRERQTQTWLKAEVAAIAEALQSSETFDEFGRCLFSRLSESVPLLYGALYVADETRARLARVGGFALDGSHEALEFAFGEGLVGQAAIEGRTLVVSANDGDDLHVSTGLGLVTPHTLVVMPAVRRGNVIGILELAPTPSLSDSQQTMLEALMPVLATNLEILSANIKTRRLLEEAQKQAEAIAAVEERSRLILTSVEEGICGIGADGLLSFVNTAGARMLGYEPEELIGQAMHMRVHYAHADGTHTPARIAGCTRPLRMDNGAPLRMKCFGERTAPASQSNTPQRRSRRTARW